MNISDAVIEEAVLNAGTEFDSHGIILRLAHQYQREYVDALSAAPGESPFRNLHAMLGRRIKQVCERLGYTGEAFCSPDIFRQESSNCIRWSRGQS